MGPIECWYCGCTCESINDRKQHIRRNHFADHNKWLKELKELGLHKEAKENAL